SNFLQSADNQQRRPLPRHHAKQGPCLNRPPYRDGRRKTAVKYLQIYGVPAIGLTDHVTRSASRFGPVESVTRLDCSARLLQHLHHQLVKNSQLVEAFTDTFLIKFVRINSARHAKRRMDDLNFFGGVLHAVYAPEFESAEECRLKLKHRCRQQEVTAMATADGSVDQESSNVKDAAAPRRPPCRPPPPPPPQHQPPSSASTPAPSALPAHPAVLQAKLAMSTQLYSSISGSSAAAPRPACASNNKRSASTLDSEERKSSSSTVGPSRLPPAKYFRQAPGAQRSSSTVSTVGSSNQSKTSLKFDSGRLLTMRPRQVVLRKSNAK
uniref:N-terminal Ras-GEF domain-containing protein n=1 Tax=Macrostomum lignano TaxID=282301 RepID=A0A1I8F145_9PLAT